MQRRTLTKFMIYMTEIKKDSFKIALENISIALIGFFILSYMIFVIVSFIFIMDKEMVVILISKHFVEIVALPIASIFSLCIVVFFKRLTELTDIELIGYKFKGALSMTILWILCFLTLFISIKLCW